MQKVKKRSEIPAEFQWDLEKLYPSQAEWNADFAAVKDDLALMAEKSGTLAHGGAQLWAVLSLSEQIDRRLEKLFTYAHQRRDEENQNPEHQERYEKVYALAVEANSLSAFIVPEILALPEETLWQYVDNTEELRLYRHFFEELLRQKAHVLPPEQEKLLALTAEIGGAPHQIFTMLNNADIRFPAVKNEAGEEVEITHGRYGALMESRDRSVRENTFRQFYSSYEKLVNTIGATLAASVKKDVFYARVRQYPSALAASLDGDRVETAVYDQLIASVHKKLPYMYRYLRLRQRLLQVDRLHMYDIYAQLIDHFDMKIPYEEAKATVLQALAPLGEDYVKQLEKGMNSGWIDVYENEGKTSGAYSGGCYDSDPYVLLNYENKLDDMFTLAHELGHSMHSYYSNRNQPYIYSQYPIFLAEVASTVNESLLSDYLLKHSRSREEKLYILNHYLEQFRATVYRQTMFAEFEKLTHAHVEAGEALTPEWMNRTYLELNRLYYGEDVELDDEIRLEWARIPHFYSAFYVYKYATGFATATSLKQQIVTGGAPAVARYHEFLASGCSRYPIETLQRAGVDLLSPEPVEQALDYFNTLMDEMEALL